MDQIIQSRRRLPDYIPPQKKKKEKEKNDVKPCLNSYQLHFEMRQKNMEKLKQSLPDALNVDKYVGNPPRLVAQPPPPHPRPSSVVKGKLVLKPVVVDKDFDDEDDNDKNDDGDVEFGDGGDGCGNDKKKNRKDGIENVEVDDGNSPPAQSSPPTLVADDCDSGVVVGVSGDDDPTEVDDDTQKYTKLFANSSASISQRELDLFAFSELLVPIVNSTQSATTFDDDPLSLLLSSLSIPQVSSSSSPRLVNPIETILTQSVQGIGFVPATDESRLDFSRQVDQLLDQEYPPDYLTPVNPIPPKKKRKSKKKEISPEEQILAQRKKEEKKLSVKSSVPRSNRKAAGLARAKFELMDKDDEEDESEIDEEFKMARSIEHHKLMTTVLMNNGLVAPPSRPSCSSSSSLSESKQKKKKNKKRRRS